MENGSKSKELNLKTNIYWCLQDTMSHRNSVFTDTKSLINRIFVLCFRSLQVCCPPKSNSSCDVLSMQYWLPAPILKHDNYSIVLQWDQCSSQGRIYALRYSWRETPCNYLQCAIYGKHNQLPAPPLIMYGAANGEWTHFDKSKPVML